MNKIGKIIVGLLLIAYLTCILLFKYSYAQGTAKQVLLGGTAIFSFTFHSITSILCLLLLSFFSVDKFFNSIFKKQFLRGLAFFCVSLFCIALPGHFVTTQADGSEMREYIFFYELKQCEITDSWVSEQIAGGYDRKYHYKPDYSCFRYCDSFFIRHYQVGKNEMFNVFNGFGPLFNLEDEDFYRN